MKSTFIWNSRTGALELREVDGRHHLQLAWKDEPLQTLSASALEVEPGAYSVVVDGRSYEARIVPGANGSWHVTVNGFYLSVELEDPRNLSARSKAFVKQGRLNVAAPMPGKVVRVLVSPGDAVEAGQGLVVVEAMKMQNEMKAPKAGKVVALAAKAGATVSAGDILVTLE